MCGDDLLVSIGKSIRHVVDTIGIKHVALGSDWDGAVRTPFDGSGLVHLTHHLRTVHGFSEPELEQIMGGNVFTFFERTLPNHQRMMENGGTVVQE